jgi:hypothetical protein
VNEQMAALKVAEDHYAKAFEAGDAKEKVQAASEYLDMLGGVVEVISALPLPAQVAGDPEYVKALTESLSGVTAPLRARGRIIAAKCVEASRKSDAINPAWSICADFAAKFPP